MSSPNEIAERRAVYDPILPLENGDRLSRAEFERRYQAMPRLKKAELVEGVVYMPSPVRHHRHGVPHSHMVIWLGFYKVRSPGLVISDNASVRLDLENEPQPDVQLLVDPALGGQTTVSADDYVEGAPELVAEIASSSASYDLGAKKDVFRRNGVHEYVVWRVLDREIDWFVLRCPDAGQGKYESLDVRAAQHAVTVQVARTDRELKSQIRIDLPGLQDIRAGAGIHLTDN